MNRDGLVLGVGRAVKKERVGEAGAETAEGRLGVA